MPGWRWWSSDGRIRVTKQTNSTSQKIQHSTLVRQFRNWKRRLCALSVHGWSPDNGSDCGNHNGNATHSKGSHTNFGLCLHGWEGVTLGGGPKKDVVKFQNVFTVHSTPWFYGQQINNTLLFLSFTKLQACAQGSQVSLFCALIAHPLSWHGLPVSNRKHQRATKAWNQRQQQHYLKTMQTFFLFSKAEAAKKGLD